MASVAWHRPVISRVLVCVCLAVGLYGLARPDAPSHLSRALEVAREALPVDVSRITRIGQRLKTYDGIDVRSGHRERITLISVYGGHKTHTYIPLLLQTAAQNADDLDMLLVNVDIGSGCIDFGYVTDPSSVTYSPNVKVVCLTEKENDELYADWLCSGYDGGCSESDRKQVDFHLNRLHREVADEIFLTFKPARGWIYKRYVETDWWSWFDADQMSHFIPYDIWHNFDMAWPTTDCSMNTPGLFTPGQMTLFRMNDKVERAVRRYPSLASVANLKLLEPGDHAHALDEGAHSLFFIHDATELDALRIPVIMSNEPGSFNRRIVLANGHIVSVERCCIERHDLQNWFERLDDPVHRPYQLFDSFTPYGWTEPALVNTSAAPCNGYNWNPSHACPIQRASTAMKQWVYRKNGEWFSRLDSRNQISRAGDMTGLETKAFVHMQEIKKLPRFTQPDFEQSGYTAERTRQKVASGRKLNRKGDKISVVEMTAQWVGSWTMTIGERPPEGWSWFTSFETPIWDGDLYFNLHDRATEKGARGGA